MLRVRRPDVIRLIVSRAVVTVFLADVGIEQPADLRVVEQRLQLPIGHFNLHHVAVVRKVSGARSIRRPAYAVRRISGEARAPEDLLYRPGFRRRSRLRMTDEKRCEQKETGRCGASVAQGSSRQKEFSPQTRIRGPRKSSLRRKSILQGEWPYSADRPRIRQQMRMLIAPREYSRIRHPFVYAGRNKYAPVIWRDSFARNLKMAIHGSRSWSSFVGICLAAVLLFISAPPALSQDVAGGQVVAKGPTLGLVLEGGGALGLAHIGVIQWLGENRIAVSYIAGTSMGGLVGGVYATGRSPAEVRELVESIDWNNVLRGQVPFENLDFRRKQDSVLYPGSIEFGLKKGIQFPAGFNSGQEVQFILDRVALPYSTIENFDQLPIPFGCVATDLVSGKKYVFSNGNFATALRSTMSLPGFFSPVRVDGHVFADGGLLDNLPVDVAKQMGADLTVAVYLETQPMAPTENLSSFGVLGKSISVMIAANEVQSMEAADVLITVPLAKFDTMDYNQANALIKAGYEAAQSKAGV